MQHSSTLGALTFPSPYSAFQLFGPSAISLLMITPRIDHLIYLALEEDAGLGDVTSRAIFSPTHRSRAIIDAKQDLVVCGIAVAARVFWRVDPAIKTKALVRDGSRAKPGQAILQLEGPTASLLTAERTALNFMQRLSGIA